MGRVIAVTNLKGGIGKTTTVVNIGAGMALTGASVLLVDVDAQGNLAMALGMTPRRTLYDVLVDGTPPADCIVSARPNLDLLPADDSLLSAQPEIARRPDWSRLLVQVLAPLKRQYDYIFIDSPGSLTVLSINALMAASEVIVPTTVEHLSMRGLALLFKQIARITIGSNIVRAIVPTMYDPRLRQSALLLEQLKQTYGGLVTAPVRINVRLSEAVAQGRTIYEYDPHSRGALDYAMLVKRLSEAWAGARPPAAVPRTVSVAARRTPAAPVADSPPAAGPAESPALELALPVAAPVVPTPAAGASARNGSGQPAAPAVAAPRNALSGSSISTLPTSCPHCGKPLRRITVAGYRIAYCDNCKYKQQELASGFRR